jgi:phospholipase C
MKRPILALPVSLAVTLAIDLVLGVGRAAAQEIPAPVPGLERINHIIVIYLENRSFDNLYGLFPGANGISAAGTAAVQVDKNGRPFEYLPPVLNTNLADADGQPVVDRRFPLNLANGPFRAEPYASVNQTTGDSWHRFYQEQYQIDGGKMDKFVAWSDSASLVMNYYDGSRLPLWAWARDYVLMDNFFHAAFGGSFLNHFFLVCACVPRHEAAPADIIATLDADGMLVNDGLVTPDLHAVNTMHPANGPNTGKVPLLPPIDLPHIGDRLDEKGIGWAWYSGGWDDAVAGKADLDFQYHHQAFTFFRDTALGTPGAKAHLKDEQDLIAAIHKGELPQVVFFKPIGEENEHPGYTNVAAGEHHTAELLKMIQHSPIWPDSLVIITYDENGGLWDHVAPPTVDRWGPGTRVPTIVVSPFAKRGFVDHTLYDTTSILKLIETRFGLRPLASRDAAANDMTAALDLR